MTRVIVPRVRFYMEPAHGDETVYCVMLGRYADPVQITDYLPLEKAAAITVRLQRVLDWAEENAT